MSFVKLVIAVKEKFKNIMFIFLDAANVISNNINVSHENVEMTEVKIGSEELYFARTNTDIADKPRQDNHASESKKYV